jgi:hypothetical protein
VKKLDMDMYTLRMKRIITFPLMRDGANTYHISGFLVAMDLRGLRAISVITATGQQSNCVGEHSWIPKKRLVDDGNVVHALRGEFDVGIVSNVLLNYPNRRNRR